MKKNMSTKILAIILSVCMIIGFTPIANAAHPFTDVKPGIWYENAVDYVYNENLFGGVGNNRFDPNAPMTRAMFVKVLANNTLNFAVPNTLPIFNDVPSGWAYDAVQWAAYNGIVNGTSESSFSPNGRLTREQMVTMLYNYSVASGIDTYFTGNAHNNFSDYWNVSRYAKHPMAWAINKGIISGTSATKLDPKKATTRAEVATMFYKARTIVPKSRLVLDKKMTDPSADFLDAFQMTYYYLRSEGEYRYDETLHGGSVYEFDMFPDVLFIMDYPQPNDRDFPYVALCDLDMIFPQIVGQSAGQATNTMGYYLYVYHMGNGPDESLSGYAAHYYTNNFEYVIYMNDAKRFTASDTVYVYPYE